MTNTCDMGTVEGIVSEKWMNKQTDQQTNKHDRLPYRRQSNMAGLHVM